MKKLLIFALVILLFGCNATGPGEALKNISKALEANDPQAFLAQFDMNSYANNEIANMTETGALNALNSFGKMLGIGGIDDLISSIVDVKSNLQDRFMREVASGELVAQCKVATTPTCPWVPQSLRDATIIELGQDAAIAKITTPARLTSWICLHKVDGKWLVVGQAVLESRAREIAAAQPVAPQQMPQQKLPERSGQSQNNPVSI